MSDILRYSIEVYDDYAVFRGEISSEIFKLIVRMCKQNGFTHLKSTEDGHGFKMIRKYENN